MHQYIDVWWYCMLHVTSFLQQVQFNLQLSDKERVDRANVVLPFEHQGMNLDFTKLKISIFPWFILVQWSLLGAMVEGLG